MDSVFDVSHEEPSWSGRESVFGKAWVKIHLTTPPMDVERRMLTLERKRAYLSHPTDTHRGRQM